MYILITSNNIVKHSKNKKLSLEGENHVKYVAIAAAFPAFAAGAGATVAVAVATTTANDTTGIDLVQMIILCKIHLFFIKSPIFNYGQNKLGIIN